MSGGKFYYKDGDLRDEIFGYTDEFSNVFEDYEISEIIWDIFELIHSFDWYKSGDTSEESYLEAKERFKEKWFDSTDLERTKRTIDKIIESAKAEIYKTYGLSNGKKGSDGN